MGQSSDWFRRAGSGHATIAKPRKYSKTHTFQYCRDNITSTGISNIVARGGPVGVVAGRHNANVIVRNADGTITKHERLVSGNQTPAEQALGFPRGMMASHTEARAVANTKLTTGDRMVITGQQRPCPSCRGRMNAAARETGARIQYQWRADGRTQIWTAGPR